MGKNLKSSLFAGILFAIFTIVWGYCTGIHNSSLLALLIATFLSGIFYSALSYLFMHWMSNRTNKVAEELSIQNNGEHLNYSGLANHFKGAESVGGHLFITDDKIIFQSHSYCIQSHSAEILLNNIVDIQPYNCLGVVPNGIKIIQNNRTDKFVVNDRTNVIRILKNLLSNKI